MKSPEKTNVGRNLLTTVKRAVDAALAYEKAAPGKRKLGITGEVGEVLACHQLGLELVIDSRSEGFDAIDSDGLRVEIKTRRSESEGLPTDAGRTSRFSEHEFDYAILVLLTRQYEIGEIWRADYDDLKPIIDMQKRRSPNLSTFKRVAKKIFPAT